MKRERYRGPLQGIPYGAKDLLAATGGPTAWGAQPYASQIFDQDAAVIQNLTKTGAILIGLGRLASVCLDDPHHSALAREDDVAHSIGRV